MGITVNASESQIIKTIEIEEGAEDHLVKTLPWDRESLDIEIFYQGKDIILPPGKKELIFKILGSSQRAGRIPMILEIRINDKNQNANIDNYYYSNVVDRIKLAKGNHSKSTFFIVFNCY